MVRRLQESQVTTARCHSSERGDCRIKMRPARMADTVALVRGRRVPTGGKQGGREVRVGMVFVGGGGVVLDRMVLVGARASPLRAEK